MLAPYYIALAESTGNSGVISALQTAFQSVSGDFTSVVTTLLPVVLGVVGMVLVVRFGINWFRSISPKR